MLAKRQELKQRVLRFKKRICRNGFDDLKIKINNKPIKYKVLSDTLNFSKLYE